MDEKRLNLLSEKFCNGSINAEERRELDSWYAETDELPVQIISDLNERAFKANLFAKIEAKAGIVSNSKYSILQYMGIAATMLLFLSAAGYFALRHHLSPISNITPGGYNATLTLASGKKIDLNRTSTGIIYKQSGLIVSKTENGQINYRYEGKSIRAFHDTNTIETPAKGQFMVQLPDGTRVWMNAKTTLIFPVVFDKKYRKVSVNGEAYFEVAHVTNDHGRVPFYVSTFSKIQHSHVQSIEVLGTHFNVDCYDDEEDVITTLLEGSVRVTKDPQSVNSHLPIILKPGEALISGIKRFKVVQSDTEAVMAWKNGEFVFNENLGSALRKISRWYGVEIIYEPDAPKDLMLGGWISRKNNLSDVLNKMESTGKVHFELKGRRVIVGK